MSVSFYGNYLTVEKVETAMWKSAFRGMRNPKNSWDKSDSDFSSPGDPHLGKEDLRLAKTLISGGTEHRKFLRMIGVSCDIVGPAYWIPELDTYKVGANRDSCSFMHKGAYREFVLADFQIEDSPVFASSMERIIKELNEIRDEYIETKDFKYFRMLRQMLPSGYRIRFTWNANYEVLLNIYKQRKNHLLVEWHDFCHWIETLPYMEEFLAAANSCSTTTKPNH